MRKPFNMMFLTAALLAIPASFVGCGGGGDEAFNPNAALFTTAPSQVTLDSGASVTYQMNGGTPLYSVTSANPNIVTASVSGLSINLTGVTSGSTQITVTDAAGAKLSFNVTVVTPGSAGPLSVTPSSLAVGNCTTRVPFIFNGGASPYRVLTTNNFDVPVSSALPLGDGRYYFLADFHYPPAIDDHSDTLTILDNQGHSTTVAVKTKTTTDVCPTNPLLVISPEAADFRRSEILAFQLSGGSPTATVKEIKFADDGVAKVLSGVAVPIVVQAVSLEQRATLMTVMYTDGQQASVVIRVLPQPLP